jgi:hypothetical protein
MQRLPKRLREFIWYDCCFNLSSSNLVEHHSWSQENELYPISWDGILRDMRALSRREHIAAYNGTRPEDG